MFRQVRRVVLYKNGVGYLGRVRGRQDVHIDFTSAQLNDALKSLTVLDLSGGRITGVDYNSEAPLARRLATLRLALGERPTVMEFLEALRGARVEEDSARTLVLEHPARPGWTLKKGAQEPEEKSRGIYRFRVSLAAKAMATLPIEEVRTVSSIYQVADLGPDQVQLFLKNGALTPEMAAALQKITTQKAVVQKLEQEMEDRQKDIDRIVDDQGRLRENMKALRGSGEEKAPLQRYTKT